MNSAAARQRICRQHFADTRTKLSDGIRRLGVSRPRNLTNVRVKIMRGQKASG